MARKLYKESKVELSPLIARYYDRIMNFISMGSYDTFIRNAIQDMQIGEGDQILDLGCGTGKNAALMADYIGAEGHITGMDLSPVMERQFLRKHRHDQRMSFIRHRIDAPFDLGKRFDIVLISFVIHGFPHEVREAILKNAYAHLKPGGKLYILDFSEFKLEEMPAHHRIIFKKVECVYAFDFIKKDWKSILADFGFSDFKESLYFSNYARLLGAIKVH
jgi:demethylmenaquinone methyltransferase/2-methoxy-6-polyprenyl-1,4-benzoquinol methylase